VALLPSYMTAQASAYWVQDNRELITDSLQSCLPDLDVLWRTNVERLAQDGWTEQMVEEYPEDAEAVVVKEGGVSYLVHPTQGQKTGFFCDQVRSVCLLGGVERGSGDSRLHECGSVSARQPCAAAGFGEGQGRVGSLLLHGRLFIVGEGELRVPTMNGRCLARD
jgi:hypothetical protein